MTGSVDRRQVIAATGAAAAGAVMGGMGAMAETTQTADKGADMIFRNGTILTMIDDRPKVAAVAVKDGKIVAAGDEAAVVALEGAATKIVDLQGATLMPSFIDAHGHFMNAPQIVKWANVSGVPAGPVRTIPDIVAVLTAHKAKWKLGPGDWIIGYGYDMTNLAEGRQLTRDDLDPAFPDNPIMLIHSSNHGAVLNSAGIQGGRHRRLDQDAAGRPDPAQARLRRA